MASIAQPTITQPIIADELVAPSLSRSAQPSAALIIADLFALIGVVAAGVSLFVRGWIHVRVVFASPGRAADRILQTFGVDVDRQIADIADRKVSAALPPTLWQFQGHYFQFVFALLVVVAILLIVGLFVSRARIATHAAALMASIGAISIAVLGLLNARSESDALPAKVGQAILDSAAANKIFALTTGKPALEGGLGWPLFAMAAGVALVFLGTLLGLIFAATRGSRR